jgi:hypothetical protein
MAKKNTATDPINDRLDALIRVTQDLFILQALLGGMQVGDVRAALKIEKARVSKISVYVKRAKRSK